ncbi:MAG: YceI family protein [Proteobacteria bacterium]|jgi:polyisoprenoid-binding protein YceI|nr:YceI family protein [Candidatus Fonsibacter sp. PEL3]
MVWKFRLIKYLFLFLFICSQSFALEKWVINTSKSSINFSIPVLLAEDVTGNFKKFTGFIEVDRKNFEGVANVIIDINSINTNYDLDYGDLIRSDVFFNIFQFPKASIKTKDFLINKDNTAYAYATVSIKGNEKDFKIPLSYNLQGSDKAIAKGTFTFKRTDFEIGTGIWSNTLILKDEVKVNVSLTLDLVK